MPPRTDIPIDNLIELYLTGISASNLAKKYNCSVWSIISRLNKNGIKVRSNKEQNEKRWEFSEDDKNTFLSLTDGALLSDASIDKKGTFHLEQTKTHCGWLYDLQDRFSQIGVKAKTVNVKPKTKIIEGREIYYKGGKQLFISAYVEMQAQRYRWYVNGIKIIPKDIILTPLCIAQWLCGDGTYNKNGSLTFCTNGFIKEDVEFLSQLLNDLGFKAIIAKTKIKNQYRLNINKVDDCFELKNQIEDFIPSCFKYKLNFIRRTKNGCLSTLEIRDIKEKYNNGESLDLISDRYSKPKRTIKLIVNNKSYKDIK